MDDLSKYLQTIDEVIAKGRYKDDWGSLSQYSVSERDPHKLSRDSLPTA